MLPNSQSSREEVDFPPQHAMHTAMTSSTRVAATSMHLVVRKPKLFMNIAHNPGVDCAKICKETENHKTNAVAIPVHSSSSSSKNCTFLFHLFPYIKYSHTPSKYVAANNVRAAVFQHQLKDSKAFFPHWFLIL